MTEEEAKYRAEQDDFSTEMIVSLQTLRREAEVLTQSLGLPMEAKYDLLAVMYHQLPFYYAETTSDRSLRGLMVEITSYAKSDSSLLFPTLPDSTTTPRTSGDDGAR